VTDRGTFRAIAGELRDRISDGRYAAGAEVPGELALAEEFGVARGTIRSALGILEDERLIEVVPGHGRRVADDDGHAPNYERVAQSLRSRLAAGEFSDGRALPSEAALCAEFDVSRTTARRAYDLLAEEGSIVRRQGAGAFAVEVTAPAGTWRVLGSEAVYESPWVTVALADVITPSGDRFRHHKLTMRAAAIVVVLNEAATHVLMSWRHRFVPDLWNWELPGGLVDAGEDPKETAAREVREEAGYVIESLTHLVSFEPMIGMVTTPHHIYSGVGTQQVSKPSELDEGTFEWVALADVPELIRKGDIRNSGSLVGLLHVLALSGKQ
jgi:DNA-binding transcriptional regulator YhcF (GntR family)/8-oxo-dGTP pyrophosphatase MutT (NUDIX family)